MKDEDVKSLLVSCAQHHINAAVVCEMEEEIMQLRRERNKRASYTEDHVMDAIAFLVSDFDYHSGCTCEVCVPNHQHIEVAVSALKRMVPTLIDGREYVAHEYDDQPYITIHCPNCDMSIGKNSERFCEYCGQSLLWGE